MGEGKKRRLEWEPSTVDKGKAVMKINLKGLRLSPQPKQREGEKFKFFPKFPSTSKPHSKSKIVTVFPKQLGEAFGEQTPVPVL